MKQYIHSCEPITINLIGSENSNWIIDSSENNVGENRGYFTSSDEIERLDSSRIIKTDIKNSTNNFDEIKKDKLIIDRNEVRNKFECLIQENHTIKEKFLQSEEKCNQLQTKCRELEERITFLQLKESKLENEKSKKSKAIEKDNPKTTISNSEFEKLLQIEKIKNKALLDEILKMKRKS